MQRCQKGLCILHKFNNLEHQLAAMILDAITIGLDRRISATFREALEGEGVGRDRVSNKLRILLAVVTRNKDTLRCLRGTCAYLCVDLPGCVVDVAEIIAKLVVTRVIPITSLSAKHLLLFLGLDALRACGNATSRDAASDETIVVAAAIEGNESVVEALVLVPVNVQIPQLLRTCGIGSVGGVVNLISKVGAAHHVVIHEQADLLVLFLGQDVHVVVRAQEALLLGGPPGEADAVVDLEVGQLGGDLKDGHAAGSIIVDTGSLSNTVTVTAKHNAVISISSNSLSNDVGGGNSLDLGIDIGNTVNFLTILEALSNRLALGAGKAKGSDMVGRGCTQSSVHFVLLVVVDNSSDGTSLARVLGLGTEGTCSSKDKSNVSLDALGKIRLVTTLVVDENEVSEDGFLVLGGRGQTHGRGILGHVISNNQPRLKNISRHSREDLIRDGIVIAQLLQLSSDVGKSSEMT